MGLHGDVSLPDTRATRQLLWSLRLTKAGLLPEEEACAAPKGKKEREHLVSLDRKASA